ncbi:MAG: tRNA preQ1(34) S-adenosylmethionine ribosyltransferase-isomerase QueA [Patescibacteria group bacterium]|nr:tRNA preQ1(34) S-adenosylmethionine ribosyltransferase-isomerase QueA [Patescibacteria group bacterium]
MLTKDFWYDLPQDRIAQEPARPRDSSKLMVLSCQDGKVDHKHFSDLPSLLKPGDLLVWNDTKVFRARLTANKNQHAFEVFLLRPQNKDWLALIKPAKKLQIGDELVLAEGVRARLVDKLPDGSVLLHFEMTDDQVFAFTDRHGQVPTPPYVKQSDKLDDYQTVYAKEIGSAAAPTAGFHFTPKLIEKIKSQGINFATVTLHVGLGTFKPITAEKLEDHIMHEEWVNVPQETLDAIAETKQRCSRVIAVGTTTVRSLESGIQKGFTNIFITPGYRFKIVDALITNFHLPGSTLIVLVSAFAQNKMIEPDAGRQFVLNAYQQAIENGYRFYSFGDAMFIQ